MLKTCEFCEKPVYNLLSKDGKKVCAACYQRAWKKGSMEYRNRERKQCSVDGCEELTEAKGFCSMHYMRLRRCGSVENDRYEKRGHASSHQLYQAWYSIKRKGAPECPSRWNDFWVFAGDVGEKPGHDYSLKKIRENEPHGPENFFWKRHCTDLKKRGDKAAYQRAYARANPRIAKRAALKRSYGIALEEYERMLKKQDGKCAICHQPETMTIKGNVISLSVDHCHDKGAMRGLLCSKCNQGLGCFKHDQDLMLKAIDYLRWPDRLI